MFDKVILHIPVPMQDWARVAKKNHLVECNEGEDMYWKTSELENLTGISMRLEGGRLTVKCSLHKIFEKHKCGRLDNSTLFAMSDAREAVSVLFAKIGVAACYRPVRVSYYEIGVSMVMRYDAMRYIKMIDSLEAGDKKEFFNDANCVKDRQKVTERSKTKKKVFKIYDKTFESADRGRRCREHVIRVETIYRRQELTLEELLSDAFARKITRRFLVEWSTLRFEREIAPSDGMRRSQIDRAEKVYRLGPEKVRAEARKKYEEGMMTAKQYRTIREFCDRWNVVKKCFKEVFSDEEIEFKTNLKNAVKLIEN